MRARDVYFFLFFFLNIVERIYFLVTIDFYNLGKSNFIFLLVISTLL